VPTFAAAFSLVYAGLAAIVLVTARAATELLVDDRTTNRVTPVIGPPLLGLAGPILWHLARPTSARRRLGRVKDWLGHHERRLDLGVLLVVGRPVHPQRPRWLMIRDPKVHLPG
jgi:hypothetical protein